MRIALGVEICVAKRVPSHAGARAPVHTWGTGRGRAPGQSSRAGGRAPGGAGAKCGSQGMGSVSPNVKIWSRDHRAGPGTITRRRKTKQPNNQSRTWSAMDQGGILRGYFGVSQGADWVMK